MTILKTLLDFNKISITTGFNNTRIPKTPVHRSLLKEFNCVLFLFFIYLQKDSYYLSNFVRYQRDHQKQKKKKSPKTTLTNKHEHGDYVSKKQH